MSQLPPKPSEEEQRIESQIQSLLEKVFTQPLENSSLGVAYLTLSSVNH